MKKEIIFCTNCGSNQKGNTFCTECGEKLKKEFLLKPMQKKSIYTKTTTTKSNESIIEKIPNPFIELFKYALSL